MAGMKRFIGFSTKKLRVTLKRPSTQEFRAAGKMVIDHIRASSSAGVDVDGKPMKRYSTKPLLVPTASAPNSLGELIKPIIFPKQLSKSKSKRIKARFFEGGYRQYKVEVTGSAVVNHRLTGRMLNGLIQKVTMPKKGSSEPVSTEITTKNDVDKMVGAKHINEHGRKWFGIGLKMKELADKVKEMWRVMVDKKGRNNV